MKETARRNKPLSSTKLPMQILAVAGGGHGGFGEKEAENLVSAEPIGCNGDPMVSCLHLLGEGTFTEALLEQRLTDVTI